MRLDHFVVHIDEDSEKLKQLALDAAVAGMPCDPGKGKGTSGFKAANIWIGDQYFEIPWLKRPDGGGWKKDWVDLYNDGKRGVFCIFLLANNIGELKKRLIAAGIPVSEEKVSFKIFGLFKKVMPWTCLHLPRLPGSNLEISFIEYEPGVIEKWISKMSPNARKNGIEGVFSCEIDVVDFQGAKNFLQKVFPNSQSEAGTFVANLERGHLKVKRGTKTWVTLFASSQNPSFVGKNFSFEDVNVTVVH